MEPGARSPAREIVTPGAHHPDASRQKAWPGHVVQFYEADAYLVAAISEHFAAGLSQGETCVVIATAEHRAALAEGLFARGFDIAVLRQAGQLLEVDAQDALERITVEQVPDETLFEQFFGGVLRTAGRRGAPVRAFGEMLALLVHQGLLAEADRLEGFWNRLAGRYEFTLCCAYPLALFGDETNGRYFRDICGRHARVLPAESYAGLTDESARNRAVCDLQQKALALAAETGRRRQEQSRVRLREERLRLLGDLTADALCISRGGLITEVNARFLELFGAGHEWQVVGRRAMDFVHPDSLAAVRERARALLAGHGDVLPFEQRMLSLDGRTIDVVATAASYDDEGETAIQIVLRDLGERRAAEAREQRLARVDAVTGLPNRTSFQGLLREALEGAREAHQQVALLHVDLDRFKLVNDTLGHDAGDQVLRQAAARMTRALRQGTVIARISSDEFTLLGRGEDGFCEGTKLAAAIIAAFHEPFEAGDRPVFSTPSIGVAVYPMDGAEPAALMRAADLALHRSKLAGGHSVAFYECSMAAESSARLDLENRLHRALELDEFRLCYQPIFDIDTGRIVSVEALLRWLPADGPALPPSEFIPVAEETGLIQPIGDWVLRTACAQVRDWQRRHPALADLGLSVNVSPRQLRDLDPRGSVQRFLDEAGLPASKLTLELTESTFLKDADLANRNLQQLRAMGVRLSIDDFGTGYSCLSYLRRLPIDELKIDRSFVHELGHDPSAAALIAAILAMAGALDLDVVAEGVETHAQLQMLRDSGCRGVQGYGLGRPMPPDEAGAFLAAHPLAGASVFSPEAFPAAS